MGTWGGLTETEHLGTVDGTKPPVAGAKTTFIIIGVDYMERVIGTAKIDVEPTVLEQGEFVAAKHGWTLADDAEDKKKKVVGAGEKVPWYETRVVIVVDPQTGKAKSFDRTAPEPSTWEITER